MNRRSKKILLLVLAAALLAGSGQMQKMLNRDRQQLDLTRLTPLKSAPPLLAFTTVALGGFRGLISNFLWIRANDLQQAGKYFEMVQLANWITDLEPHFPQVWLFQAWNMAWNISVNFKDFPDRWHWVERGIELLRDDGLRYNPDEPLLYFQLSWIFQSKMGQNMDDANLYYKEQWANEMMPFFGPNGTNFDELIHPQTSEDRARAALLRDKYKMDPAFVKQVDEEWGPLDWRVPEASAIYWAALGLEKAREHPDKITKASDLTSLRRSIYQSMLQALYHGRLVINPFDKSYDYYPDLDLVSKINDAYNTMYAEEPDLGQKQAVQHAQRNFLRDAVYFLYEDNRLAEAAKWFAYLGRNYPDQPLLDGDPNSLPSQLTLDEYAVACVQGDVKDIDQNRNLAAIEGLLGRAYYELAIGQDDRATIAKLLATKIYQRYETQVASFQGQPRVGLPPFADINRTVLDQLLDPKQGLPYAARAVLRTQLRLPPESAATHTPPAATVSTNVPETVETNAASSVVK
ncbi:MAG TPA: hypothetical protein VMA35_10605 [Candidatus Sulfopaludibacter sp.]|nr:hypothetical protein [Candidatus Sulfopaludibacter sp.]